MTGVQTCALPIYIPDWIKIVWLDIKFVDEIARGPLYLLPNFSIDPMAGYEIIGDLPYPGSSGPVLDPTDPTLVSWRWTIRPQPPFEILNLTNAPWNFGNLAAHGIAYIRVASRCVPEPTTLGLLLLGGLSMLARRRG